LVLFLKVRNFLLNIFERKKIIILLNDSHSILFFYFIGLGSNLSSLSPYILTYFPNEAEIIFLSIQFTMPLGSFFGGWISDYTKQLRWLLFLGLVLVIPCQFFLFSFPEDWRLTCLFGGLHRFLLSSNYQWLVIGVIEQKGEASFSKIRASGTLGFLFVQLLLFILTHPFISLLENSSQTGKLGAFAYLAIFPFLHFFPLQRHSSEKYEWSQAVALIKQKKFIIFFGLSFVFYSAYQVTDNYMGRYLQISYGLDSVFLGWMLAVILEAPFLVFVPKLNHKFGYSFLFLLSLAAGSLRFLLFFLSPLGLPKHLVLLFQIPHAILFAGYYMGGIYWFRKHSPSHVYGSIYGIFSIFSISFGGMLGNIFCSLLLKDKLGSSILGELCSNYKSLQGDFALIFLICAIIFFILFIIFFNLHWQEYKKYHL